MTYSPRVKICCISSIDEAQLAIQHGAAALGLVSNMPSGPGVIPDELIAEIVSTVPPPISTFLLTSLQDADAIIQQHAICKTSTLQLVDHVDPNELVKLRRYLPHIKLVQVIHVMGESAIADAREVANYVDAILLDSGNPTLEIKELGGTGKIHDWKISREIRDKVNIPIFLAGGLHEENIKSAIRSVQPFGIDLCSSVRKNGKLCSDKLAKFMHAVQTA